MNDDLETAHQITLRQIDYLYGVMYRAVYLTELSHRMELSPLACASLLQARYELRDAGVIDLPGGSSESQGLAPLYGIADIKGTHV